MRKGYLGNIDNKSKDTVEKESNKKYIIKFFVWLSICVFVYYQIYVLISYTLGNKSKENMWLYNGVNAIILKVAPKNVETTETYTLKLAALGDIYASNNVLRGAKVGTKYNFMDSFVQTKEVLSGYDVVLASLNTPVAGANVGYSTQSLYNAPDELLETVKDLGVSVLATAGNNLMDKGKKGVETTVEKINEIGLNQIGLNSSKDRVKPHIIEQNNIRIAILSYMADTNKNKENLVNILTEDNIKEDMEYVNTQNVDYTICYINIPNVDASIVNAEQKFNVEILFENGVDIALGTGSKVVQSKLEDVFEYSNGSRGYVYALYSLGDFIGDMNTDERRTSIAADITFTKDITTNKNGEVIEEKTKKNMMINKPLSFYTSVSSTYKTINYPIDITIDNYNEDKKDLTIQQFNIIRLAQERIHEILM